MSPENNLGGFLSPDYTLLMVIITLQLSNKTTSSWPELVCLFFFFLDYIKRFYIVNKARQLKVKYLAHPDLRIMTNYKDSCSLIPQI